MYSLKKSSKYFDREIIVKGREGNDISCLWYGAKDSGRPLMAEFHGGGFVIGHHYINAQLCRKLCELLNINVVSIEYRYAPKATFPKSTYDGYDAILQLLKSDEDFDRDKIMLSGHSAGANICAGICLLCGENDFSDFSISGQILNYPYLDADINPRFRPKIFFSIPRVAMRFFAAKYYPNKSDRILALASPVYTDDKQAKTLPPTLITVCGRDNLKVDAQKYCRLLCKNNVKCKVIEYPRAIHGFIEMAANRRFDRQWYLSRKLIAEQYGIYQDFLQDMQSYIKDGELII